MLEIACVVQPGQYPGNDDRAVVNSKLIEEGAYTENAATRCFAAVCDGVAGTSFGNEAAQIVARHFSGLSGAKLTVDLIGRHVIKANEKVAAAQAVDYARRKMSTTIAGIYIDGDDFIAFNVGDSRVYRCRTYLYQISKDHSVRQEQIELGLTPKPGAENYITRYMGGTIVAIPEIVDGAGKVLINDLYVLCTDGVWGDLTEDEFEDILSRESNLENACRRLIDLAVQNGSKDDLSVIIIRRT